METNLIYLCCLIIVEDETNSLYFDKLKKVTDNKRINLFKTFNHSKFLLRYCKTSILEYELLRKS